MSPLSPSTPPSLTQKYLSPTENRLVVAKGGGRDELGVWD